MCDRRTYNYLPILDSLWNIVSTADFCLQYLDHWTDRNVFKNLECHREVQDQKLFGLLGSIPACLEIAPDRVIFNVSDCSLSDVEKQALAHGLCFALKPEKLDYCKTLAPFKFLLRHLSKLPYFSDILPQKIFKNNLCTMALNYFHKFKPSNNFGLQKEDNEAL